MEFMSFPENDRKFASLLFSCKSVRCRRMYKSLSKSLQWAL